MPFFCTCAVEMKRGIRYNCTVMSENRQGKLSVSVRGLIIALLLVDIVTMTVLIMRSREETRDVLVPTAAPTAVAALPTEEPAEETPEPEPVEPHAALINLKYQREVYTAENLNDGFASEWVITGDGSAYAETANTYDTATVQVYTTGNAITSVGLTLDGIPFQSGHNYTVFLNVSSSVPRTIAVNAYNGDTGVSFGSKNLSVTPEMTYYEFPFTVNATTYSGGLTIEFGNNGISDAHTITVQGVRIAGADDNAAVRTNQIGYFASAQKRCTFIYSCGDLFDVVNKETGNIAYTGAIVGRMENGDTGETDYYGDFTNFREPGTYFIRSQTGVISHEFTISADPFDDLRDAALRMLSFQRCGMELTDWAGDLAHPACHMGQSNFYLTDVMKDTTGGWHDAGDYGRYTQTGTKAVNDLLLSYMTAPELFDDENNGPESGNGVPDILDEARYELEWILKMQDDGGAFFCKAVSQSFPDDFIAPEDDTAQTLLLAPDTVSTADAVGSLAMAYMAFQEIDHDFAEKCLEAAKAGEHYLATHKDYSFTFNPMGISAGQYLDARDTDGRFTAYMALYAATGEQGYLDSAKGLYEDDSTVANGFTWKDNGMYGAYLFLASSSGKKDDPEFYSTMLAALAQAADNLVNFANGNSYHLCHGLFAWGSNSDTANYGLTLSLAYQFTGKQIYYQTAVEQMNYLLGKNSLDLCFVSGFGFESPHSQHNRLALSKHASEIGFLSGGPDASREDNITQALPADTPNAKVYADDYRSYSTNEIAIYYNSALLYLLTSLS